jgi:hypothetical protein
MKSKILAILLIALGSALASGVALAHGRVHFGIGFGAPFYYGPPAYYYPPPYYYYPPAVAYTPPAPPVYVEQNAAPAAPAQLQYWYYCDGAQGYYPYVKQCPGGWRQVAPQPAS